ARRGSSVAWARAPISPSAVSPMNVPPTRTAATKTPGALGQITLASTPAASTTQAAAKVVGMPRDAAKRVHSATDGTAAMPNTTQMTGPIVRIAGVARTIATKDVAVMT